MAEFQRKIELQSPEDLQYLVSNIRRAAHTQIEKDLPLGEGGKDDYRVRVEHIVNDYVNSVIRAAAQNITINGLEPSKELMKSLMDGDGKGVIEIEEHEAFDNKLFERAKELARQEEDLIEEIAALRRKVPGSVRDTVAKDYREGIERDEGQLRMVDEKVNQMESGTADLAVGKLERQEEVERSWQKGVTSLGGLMRTMPEMVARKERAEQTEEYVLKAR